MKKIELSGRRGLTSTFVKGALFAPSVNVNIAAVVYHLQQYANKVKGTGAAFAPCLLLYLFLSVQRINRNNQGETVGYICSYTKIAQHFNASRNTVVRAAKWLERQDWLTITKNDKTSVFNLNVEKIDDCLNNPSTVGYIYDNGEMWAALLPKSYTL